MTLWIDFLTMRKEQRKDLSTFLSREIKSVFHRGTRRLQVSYDTYWVSQATYLLESVGAITIATASGSITYHTQ
jgi:hypothetical protein